MAVQPGLCGTWSETPTTVFSERGSYSVCFINTFSTRSYVHVYKVKTTGSVYLHSSVTSQRTIKMTINTSTVVSQYELIILLLYVVVFSSVNCFFLFFLFLFNVPLNNFSVMLRRSHLFLGITSTFGE